MNEEQLSEAEEILKDRSNQYGSYNIFTLEMLHIMNMLRNRRRRTQLNEKKDELDIEDIDNFFLVLKILRKETSEDKDSIIDLENYAKLIKEARY